MGELYRLDFSNGKSYIGMTTKTAARRFERHCVAAQSGKWPYPLYRAWRKYGSPRLTILMISHDNDALCAKEISAIRKFKTLWPRGYNLSLGGEMSPMANPVVAAKVSAAMKGRTPHNKGKLGARPSLSSRLKMSMAGRGRPKSIEHRAKIGAAHRGIKETPEARRNNALARLGKHLSLATRLKMSATRKGKAMPAGFGAWIAKENTRRSDARKERLIDFVASIKEQKK
jgi:hypothetical protein